METVQYEWVLARHRHNSDQAKIVIAHAGAGIGYHVVNPQRGKTEDVICAFKNPVTGYIPQHLERASKAQTEKLDLLDFKRRGAH